LIFDLRFLIFGSMDKHAHLNCHWSTGLHPGSFLILHDRAGPEAGAPLKSLDIGETF
jgi:hypothetical protein